MVSCNCSKHILNIKEFNHHKMAGILVELIISWILLWFICKEHLSVLGKSRASEILNKKRKLSLEMIRQLHEKLNIPTDVLIQAY